MNSTEIENVITEKEKELKGMLLSKKTVEQAKLIKQREKLELENQIGGIKVEINVLTEKIKEARYSTDKQELEIKLLTKDFWAAKNSGG